MGFVYLLADVPISVFRGDRDKQLADVSLFSGWFNLLRHQNTSSNSNTSSNTVVSIPGDHGLVFNAADRAAFFNKVVEVLDSVLLGIEYGQ